MDNRGKREHRRRGQQAPGCRPGAPAGRRADVFVCNLLPRRQAKYGLDTGTLLALNPRLVHATLTGYGAGRPGRRARPGYDLTAFFGRGAVLDAMTEPDNPAPRGCARRRATTPPRWHCSASILAALRLVEAHRRGPGRRRQPAGDRGLDDVQRPRPRPWSTAWAHRRRAGSPGRTPCTAGSAAPTPGGSCCSCPSRTGGRGSARRSAGRSGSRTSGSPPTRARAANMPELTRLMDEVFATRPLREWCALFDERGFIWGPASTVDEFAADEQAAADGLFPSSTRRRAAVPHRRAPLRMPVPTSPRGAPRPRSVSTPTSRARRARAVRRRAGRARRRRGHRPPLTQAQSCAAINASTRRARAPGGPRRRASGRDLLLRWPARAPPEDLGDSLAVAPPDTHRWLRRTGCRLASSPAKASCRCRCRCKRLRALRSTAPTRPRHRLHPPTSFRSRRRRGRGRRGQLRRAGRGLPVTLPTCTPGARRRIGVQHVRLPHPSHRGGA